MVENSIHDESVCSTVAPNKTLCGYPQKPLFYEVFFRETVIQLFPTNHSKSSFRQVEKINHQKNMLSAVQKIIKI